MTYLCIGRFVLLAEFRSHGVALRRCTTINFFGSSLTFIPSNMGILEEWLVHEGDHRAICRIPFQLVHNIRYSRLRRGPIVKKCLSLGKSPSVRLA